MSKRPFLKIVLTLAGVAVLAGTGSAQQRYSIDKTVAVVGNSPILYSEVMEVVQQFAEMRRSRGITSDRNAKIEALEELLQQKLLFNQAQIDSIEISRDNIAQMAEDRVTEMLQVVGSVQDLEAQFHRPIYEIKREISSRIEEGQYAQRMRGELDAKVRITPGEVERYYKKLDKDSIPVVPIQYIYAQITKLPNSTDEAKRRTREQMLSLRERIINGTRFDVLARMYSEDPGSAMKGGEMDPMPVEHFEAPFGRALEKLRVGQVSEIVETIYGFHIIELLDKKGNLYTARHILLRPQFTDEEMLATNKSLDSLANLIRHDSLTFEKAALQNSSDKYSKNNGGLVSNLELLEMYMYMDASEATTKHFKENLAVDDFRALDKLKPGEISDAFRTEDLKGNKMSKIVKLIEIVPSHPASLKDDYLLLEALALQQKQEDEYEKWLSKKIDSMFIRIDPDFRLEEEFENKAWLR